MTRVLVVDDDGAMRGVVARHLASHGYDVQVVDGVSAASDVLRGGGIDVLLTDLRMPEQDGIDLLAAVRGLSPKTRAVLMSAFASARDYQTAVSLGAVTVLCKPFTPADLLSAIRQAEECESGFHGTFHGMSLVDILQMFHFGRRSVSIHVTASESGTVHVQDGEVIHAERGSLSGVEAFAAILASKSGAIRTTVLVPDARRTIHRSFESLLLDSLRELDEASRDDLDELSFSVLPPPTPSQPPPFEERVRAMWRLAVQALGVTSEGLTAIAISCRTGERGILAGTADPEVLGDAGEKVLATIGSLAGGGDLACDLSGAGVALGVVRSEREALAIVLFEAAARPSSVSWFRSCVGTVARCMQSASV